MIVPISIEIRFMQTYASHLQWMHYNILYPVWVSTRSGILFVRNYMIPQNGKENQELHYEPLIDIMNRPLIPHPHWIQGILASGVNLLVGAPKAKKSFLALEMGLCISSNIPFTGKYPVNPTSVLYLCLDSDDEDIHERMNDVFNYATWDTDNIYFMYECLPNQWDLLIKFLESHPEFKLIIIDTIAWMRASSKNANSYLDDYHFMSKFKRLYSGLGVSSLLLHHTRKMEADNFMDETSGSRGITGGAHNILNLTKKGDISTLKGTGNKLKVDFELNLTFMNGYQYTEVKQTIKQQIVILLSTGPRHYQDIATQLGRTPNVIAVILKQMVDESILERQGRGIYQLKS